MAMEDVLFFFVFVLGAHEPMYSILKVFPAEFANDWLLLNLQKSPTSEFSDIVLYRFSESIFQDKQNEWWFCKRVENFSVYLKLDVRLSVA